MPASSVLQPASKPRARPGALRRREARAGLLFVLPWIVGLLVFKAYPVLATIILSFSDYDIIQAPHWVGLQNYSTMLTADPDFWNAAGNSVFYVVVSVPSALIVSLLLALLLNTRITGRRLYRTLIYLPALVPPVVATLVFLVVFEPEAGLVNTALGWTGLPTPGWLTDPAWSKPTLVILSLWGSGTAVLVFLAGLQDVPRHLLEAATVDGAGPVQRFLHVTLPLLSPVLLFNLVMGIIASFQVFTQAMVVGGSSGDPVGSTLMFMVLIYENAFGYLRMGYAEALSVVLFLAVAALTLVIFWSSRLWVYYEGGSRGA
jgi:multiple sugar transport system permease protein